MSEETTYYQRNWETMLNRAKKYYEGDKERLRVQAKNKCRELSEEKNIRRGWGKNIARLRNLNLVISFFNSWI